MYIIQESHAIMCMFIRIIRISKKTRFPDAVTNCFLFRYNNVFFNFEHLFLCNAYVTVLFI